MKSLSHMIILLLLFLNIRWLQKHFRLNWYVFSGVYKKWSCHAARHFSIPCIIVNTLTFVGISFRLPGLPEVLEGEGCLNNNNKKVLVVSPNSHIKFWSDWCLY